MEKVHDAVSAVLKVNYEGRMPKLFKVIVIYVLCVIKRQEPVTDIETDDVLSTLVPFFLQCVAFQ